MISCAQVTGLEYALLFGGGYSCRVLYCRGTVEFITGGIYC
jgi:hypothetical protein